MVTAVTSLAELSAAEAPLTIAGRAFRSRLMVGTGKYASNAQMMREAIEASGAEVVTVAVRRVDLDRSKDESILASPRSRSRYFLLANTAGCYSVSDAIRYARLARAAGFNEWVKLEVIADEQTLLPDPVGVVEATRDTGGRGVSRCWPTRTTTSSPRSGSRMRAPSAVMPLASPIGSGLGLLNPYAIRTIKHRLSVPVIVDAGVGTASDACVDDGAGRRRRADEHGYRGGTGSGPHGDGDAARRGRGTTRFLAGRMPRREVAVPSSPTHGNARMTEKPPGGGAGPSSGAIRFVMPADSAGATAAGPPAGAAPDADHPGGTGAPPPARLPRVPVGGITDSRVAAADVLADLRGGELLDAAFDRRAGRLDARDRRWTQELVYGTLRRRAWIDSLLLTRVRGGLARLDADVTDLLRLGAYQLLHMGSVPAYAAIAQTVELTKRRHGIGASRLANAVLRRLDRERAEAPPALDAIPPTDPLDALALAFSHPRWLIARWVARWGAEEAAALLEANNAEAPVVLRPYGIVREQLEAMLEAAGVQHEEAPFVRDSIQLRVTPALTELGAYRQGLFFVQDPAATLVTQYACVAPGTLVVDLCAAPGGKALELSRTASLVVAADRSVPREQRLRGNLRRVEARNVVSVVADAMSPPFAPADAVLLECPLHGHRDVPAAPRCTVAAQAVRSGGDGGHAARPAPRGVADRAPGRPADLLDVLPRDRRERRSDREFPRRSSRLGARASAGRSGARGRARRRTAADAPAAPRGGRRVRGTTPPGRRSWRLSLESFARRFAPYVAVAVGGFALAYVFVLLVVFPVGGQPEQARIPNVLGLTFDEAATRLTAAGFRAQQGESRFNVGSPKSTVLTETPGPETSAAKGTRIVIDVSAGQRRMNVPNVVGMDREAAQLALEKVGLEVGSVSEHESPLPRGEVMTTSPAAGTALILPSSVAFVVSAGPATIEVPYLVGRPFGEARAALEQLGLTAQTAKLDSTSNEPEGVVTSQSPTEGTAVGAGSAVALTVSRGLHSP